MLSPRGGSVVQFGEGPTQQPLPDVPGSDSVVVVPKPTPPLVNQPTAEIFVGNHRLSEVDLTVGTSSPIVIQPARAPVHSSVSAPTTHSVDDAWEVKEADVAVSDRIGGGSYGDIFKGRYWGTDVAVKLIVAAVVTDEVSCVCRVRLRVCDSVRVVRRSLQVLTSFKAEVSILAQLRHPNVVLYIGACTRPPNVFIVTEWCERGGLNDLLYDLTKPLSATARIDFAFQAANGMAYLHKCVDPCARGCQAVMLSCNRLFLCFSCGLPDRVTLSIEI